MPTRKLIVEIVGDTKSLERAFGRVEKRSSALSRGLKIGAGAALGGLALAARAGFNELEDMQRQQAQTEAALKSTGSAANVTAKQIDDLSQSILNQSGIDDEAVKAAENMLLTFTNVRNEVGKGNDIFNQATQAVADMATRMNNGAIPSAEDLSATSIRLGKALNDPVKGLGALSRVGVQFTKEQRDQVKALVATGHTMEAQKLILAELTKEFGGSAKAAGETLPGQLAKSREAFNNMAGELTVALLPAMTEFAKIVASVSQFLQRHTTIAKIAITTIAALTTAVFATNAAFKVYTATTRLAAASNFLFGRSAVAAAGGANAARLSLVGKLGLVAAASAASFAITSLILKATGLDKKLRSLGGSAFDAAAKLGLVNDPNAQFAGKTVLSPAASGFLRRQSARLQASGLTEAQVSARLAATHPNVAQRDIDVLSHLGTAAGRTNTIVVQSPVILDGREISRNTTEHQERNGRRRATQTRGRQRGK